MRAAGEGKLQYGKALFIQTGIVDVVFALLPAHIVKFFLRKQSFLTEEIKIDEIRVSREGGKTLIRAVAIAGRSQRENLPVFLSGVLEKINELIGSLAEGSDSIGRGETGYRHENACAAGEYLLFFHESPP